MNTMSSEPVKSAARACVIFNPAAKGDKARRFRRCLEAIGAECVLKATTAPGDARRLAAEAISEGFDSIIAAGGDGTLNEVVNGFGDAPDGFERACLGVLPLGTVNVFARELGIPTRPEPAWEVIRQRREARVDLPCVEFSGQGGRERRYFVQLAGAGLDARAIELVNWPLKKKIGPLAYVVAGLKALLEKPASITVSAGVPAATGQLVLIGNGRLYGGHFNIFRGAICATAGWRCVCFRASIGSPWLVVVCRSFFTANCRTPCRGNSRPPRSRLRVSFPPRWKRMVN